MVPRLRALSLLAGAQPRNFQGVCLAILSSILLIAVSAMGKLMAEDMHPFEIGFLRAVLLIGLSLPWFLRVGFRRIDSSRPWLQMINGLIFSSANTLWFWALPSEPLDMVAAVGLTSQLFAILGAILFLGEKPRAWRWAALAVGLVGCLIILRPGFIEMTSGIMMLAVALLSAGSRLLGKHILTQDYPETLVFWQAIWGAVLTFPLALMVWRDPSPEQWLWLFALAFVSICNQFTLAWALRLADLGAIEPIRFLRLVWAALVGLVLFGDIPNIFTFIGGTVVIGSVIYIAQRERLEGRPRPNA